MKRAPWPVLAQLQQQAVDDAARDLASRVAEAEQAALRLSERQASVEAERQTRAEATAQQLQRSQAGEARIADLQQLQAFRYGSEQREATRQHAAAQARQALERAADAQDKSQQRLVQARAEAKVVERLDALQVQRQRDRSEQSAEEEATEAWTARRPC